MQLVFMHGHKQPLIWKQPKMLQLIRSNKLLCQQNQPVVLFLLQVTDETLDLERMYADLRKRAKSQALAKSEWLKRNAASGTPAFKPGGNIMGGAKKTKSKGKVSGGGGMW